MEDIQYFLTIFFPRDLFSMISGKEWLDGSNLLMCYSHAGSLVSQGDLERQISHICCFRMFELIARLPKKSFNFHVQNNYHSKQLPSITPYSSSKKVCVLQSLVVSTIFKMLFLRPFQGTRAGYHGSRSSTSAVGD